MGSFANSLHVKCDDEKRVAEAIGSLLAEQGWRPTEKRPNDDPFSAKSPSVRGLYVSAPVRGWVSVLDSDLPGVHGLASGLAQKLNTHAIFFLVNDSDAWSYLLADPDGRVSEFDSMPDDDDDFDEESVGHLNQLTEGVTQFQALMRDGGKMQRLQELTAQMLAEAPPEFRELEAKMRSGRFTPADVQRYSAWSMQQMPKFLAQLDPQLANLLGGPRAQQQARPQSQRSKAPTSAQQKRLDELRPLLAAGVTDEQVQGVLDRQAAFAEDVLAEFLPLLGLPSNYANLSHRYLRESRPAELEPHGIRFIQHLRFETDQSRDFSALTSDL